MEFMSNPDHIEQDINISYTLTNPATYWLTGLSGARKSTLSKAVKAKIDSMLHDKHRLFILDGEIIRRQLNNDLGYSDEDVIENNRRVSEVAKLMVMSG